MNLEQTLHCLRPAIQSMEGYLPGEQPRAGKAIKLNTNENPYPPSPQVNMAIQQALSQGLQKYPDPLATPFRIRAADLFGVTPDHILCGNGSDDLLTILVRAFLGPGRTLRMPYPSYILYRSLAELQEAGCECLDWEAEFNPPKAFAREPFPHLVILPNPNSPSGTLVPVEKLREWASSLKCPFVIDEAYIDFAAGDSLPLVKEFPNVILTRTLSKSYSLAGLRFGFAIAHPDLIQALRKVKDSYNCDALSIAAATAAIDDQDWLQVHVGKVIATRNRMTERLMGMGFQVAPSQANFVWCTWPGRALKPIYESLKKQQVLVRYMDYSGWGEGLRISVGTDSESETALTLLEATL